MPKTQIEFSQTSQYYQVILRPHIAPWASAVLGILIIASSLSFLRIATEPLRMQSFDLVDFLIPFTLMGLASLYLGRLFLWNQFGKEVLKIEQEQFHFYYDYGLFKSSPETITFQKAQAFVHAPNEATASNTTELLDEALRSDQSYCFSLKLDQEYYQSVVQLPAADIKELIDQVNNYLR